MGDRSHWQRSLRSPCEASPTSPTKALLPEKIFWYKYLTFSTNMLISFYWLLVRHTLRRRAVRRPEVIHKKSGRESSAAGKRAMTCQRKV